MKRAVAVAKTNLSTTDAQSETERAYAEKEILVTDIESEANNLSAILGMYPHHIPSDINPGTDQYGVESYRVVLHRAPDREKALAIRRRILGW